MQNKNGRINTMKTQLNGTAIQFLHENDSNSNIYCLCY